MSRRMPRRTSSKCSRRGAPVVTPTSVLRQESARLRARGFLRRVVLGTGAKDILQRLDLGKNVDDRALRLECRLDERFIERDRQIDATERYPVVLDRRRFEPLEAVLVWLRCQNPVHRDPGRVVDPDDI